MGCTTILTYLPSVYVCICMYMDASLFFAGYDWRRVASAWGLIGASPCGWGMGMDKRDADDGYGDVVCVLL